MDKLLAQTPRRWAMCDGHGRVGSGNTLYGEMTSTVALRVSTNERSKLREARNAREDRGAGMLRKERREGGQLRAYWLTRRGVERIRERQLLGRRPGKPSPSSS